MRIAILSDTYTPFVNGVVTHIKVLREGLLNAGHEVLIVTVDPAVSYHVLADGVLRCPAKQIKRLYGYGVINFFNKISMRYISDFNPDVIHIQQEFSSGLLGIRAAKKLDVPLIHTLHTMYDEYLFYVAPKLFFPLVRTFAYRYMRYISKRTSALVSCSNKAIDFYQKCKVTKPVTIVPNSVELDAFDPQRFPADSSIEIRKKYAIPPDALVGIFVGRLGQEKSVDLLIDYWSEHFVGQKSIRLLIVGEGPDKEKLMEHARIKGVEHLITFTGRVEHEEVMPIYLASNFYISASLSEMMSISMLEGMAAGLLVIQRYDPVNAHQIQEGINGFNYNNSQEMADYVLKMASLPPENRVKIREKVRESVKSAGSQQSAAAMLDIYNQALSEYNPKKSRS